MNKVVQRQDEDIKTGIPSQQGFGDAESAGAAKAQHRFPLAGGDQPEEEAEKKGYRQYHQIEETAYHHHPVAEDDVFPDGRRQPARQEKAG